MNKYINTFDIKNFTFTYAGADIPALTDVNISVSYGEFITVCGKTGSGKSTLLRNLKTVLAPEGKTLGQIEFYGRAISDVSHEEQARRVGFVLQDPENQIVTDKVWHELAFGLENLGVDTHAIRIRVAEMATFFGIEPWIDKDVSQLSGGQKQLLNLAAIMTLNPDVLILDEPTSYLDPIASEEFIDTLSKINREIGTTVIISEHNLNQVMPISDRVIVMDDGKIIVDDKPEKIGQAISENDKDLILSMPVPLQVYLKLKSKDSRESEFPIDLKNDGPLTVRDGRNLLTDLFKKTEITVDAVTLKKSDMSESEISLRDIRFKYSKDGSDVIKNLEMKIPKGQITTIVGGNGSGKSTLLRIIAGTLKPYKGKVKAEMLKMALLPQNPQVLFVAESVEKELKDVNINTDEISQLMELNHLKDRHPYDLSGGEQQRLALGKILLVDAEILLLDEPSTGLDGANRAHLGGIIKKLAKEGKTIVMVSHDLEFAAEYSDNCMLLFDGQIMSKGIPSEFFSGNNFYTTAGNRMSRHIFKNAVTPGDVSELCRINMEKNGTE